MWARVTRYRWASPLTQQELDGIEREVIDVLAGSPGFKAYYAVKVSDTESVVINVWETQAAAEEAFKRIGPAQQRIVGAKVVGEPQRSGGEVVYRR
jgi:heme-degrading monooxygenase HmoA